MRRTLRSLQPDEIIKLVKVIKEDDISLSVTFIDCDYTIDLLGAELTIHQGYGKRKYWTEDTIKSIGLSFGYSGVHKIVTDYI